MLVCKIFRPPKLDAKSPPMLGSLRVFQDFYVSHFLNNSQAY